jgi:Sulfotransferase family
MVTGLIHRALPQARILNLVRDPMDVCFSNYRALLGEAFPWSYDLNALAQHYQQYRQVMVHWHAAMPGVILDVDYADLTRDPETTARKVLAFCGLEWEPGCADVTRNKAAVATLSMSQVREPIHTRFFDEWRRYEKHLLPLRQAINA